MKRLYVLFLLLALLLSGCQAAAYPRDSGDAALSSSAAVETVPPPGSGWDGRPRPIVSLPAVEESVSLTCWDGEVLLEQFCCAREDLDALAQALPGVQGYMTGDSWRAPKPPWPVYGLRIYGVEEDFEAVFCGGDWLDSEGNVLREFDVDLPALWKQFAQDPQPGAFSPPAIRELALRDGAWDPRFLREAKGSLFSPLVSMELTISDSGIGWTIRNETGQGLLTGNGSTAVPLVDLGGAWYHVPMLSGKHYSWTTEARLTPPGETFSGTFWEEPYAPLPDGDYCLVLRWSTDTGLEGLSAAPFHIHGGTFYPAEE